MAKQVQAHEEHYGKRVGVWIVEDPGAGHEQGSFAGFSLHGRQIVDVAAAAPLPGPGFP